MVEYLLERGLAVTVATCLPFFGVQSENNLRLGPALARLYRPPHRIRIVARMRLVSIGTDTAVLRPLEAVIDETGSSPFDEVVEADSVVLVGRKHNDGSLADRLRAEGVGDVRVIGDALSARDLQTAIRQGHLTGRSIE